MQVADKKFLEFPWKLTNFVVENFNDLYRFFLNNCEEAKTNMGSK